MYLISLLLPLSLTSAAFAGPACVRRTKDLAACRAKCGQRWGWPGHTFGMDPWGSVVSSSDSSSNTDTQSMPPMACGGGSTGVSGAAGQDSQGNSSDPVVNPGGSPLSSTPLAYSAPTPESIVISPSSASLPSDDPSPSPSSESINSPPHSSQTHSSVHHQPTTTTRPPSPPRPRPTPTTTSSETHVTEPSSPPPPPPPTPPPPSNPPSSGSGTSNSDISQYLQFHNTIRAQHGAKALTWNDEAAEKAQQWANNCKFQHSGGSLGPLGENLAAGTGDFSIKDGVQSWTNEQKDYDPGNPQPSHYTQVVWKGTTSVGCAQATCNGIFDASFGPANYIVCEYSPPGNVIGAFGENVQ